jgi:hypothetical protein
MDDCGEVDGMTKLDSTAESRSMGTGWCRHTEAVRMVPVFQTINGFPAIGIPEIVSVIDSMTMSAPTPE